MKVIIAGSRTFGHLPDAVDPERRAQQLLLYEAHANLMEECLAPLLLTWPITEVVSGKAPGADTLGELWASWHGIPVDPFRADWRAHGKRAGFIRNEKMSVNAEALVAFWDGVSRGTQHMIGLMERMKKPVEVFRF